ncbi:hypothetical protein A2160_01465 [Candidatus Beckwithbacteria bacterium RBG_13_42_9]|uniref:Uncharacterized protein n=1 Tax=Candidatus Beckwithbacteria bacterium RBG_13_42_9 TaxID=1797457 RepID=A0A1F5E939_9BACT|nr:MAG: hypothetical protein A2160_01465 [Candidatus Beckwithbacteria bacterium RBG_13_42_9]
MLSPDVKDNGGVIYYVADEAEAAAVIQAYNAVGDAYADTYSVLSERTQAALAGLNAIGVDWRVGYAALDGWPIQVIIGSMPNFAPRTPTSG